ncbi:CDP-alcohol phosphatidyltransferase family protein [Parvicella tangerina]|uniref:CDP-diacylglycerol--serine O-phosphatidyltransferase n=1 Tax=Parvicella tangerina TaxID=2829795 RepID=A0A916JLC7_9FLAO|nr:CDP-alcohol phosphatidyltransferase family protein [Parvicella tangerina]CAG5079828.1 hypothetical protein CRYO30217_01087 [Parvicella tangerina]
MKKHIPNIITLGNLTCGLLSIMYAFSDTPWVGAYFIFGGLFLDFFDGFFARILKVDGELGKQLDSLADLVTFGVAPGMLMYHLINYVIAFKFSFKDLNLGFEYQIIPYIALLIPILSAVRLAKFNIATNQSDEFIGLPTPANAIYFASLALIVKYDEATFDFPGVEYLVYLPILLSSIIIFSLLLNANLPLIALKFKTFGWKGNEVRFIFLGLCVVTILVALLISNVFVAVPIIILLYLIISIINNITKRKDEVQSKH